MVILNPDGKVEPILLREDLIISIIRIQGGSCYSRIFVIYHCKYADNKVRESDKRQKDGHTRTTCRLVLIVAVWVIQINLLTVEIEPHQKLG